MTDNTLLAVRDLAIDLEVPRGDAGLVRGVSFDLDRGASLALVGESGSGKSLTCLALGGLLPRGLRITGGRIRLDSTELVGASRRTLRSVRGRRIGFVFQDPSAALDPLFPVGRQLVEVMRVHRNLSRGEAEREARSLMEELEIPRAAQTFKAYPHELSGGMKQRICIGLALASNPEVLVADEPTTALDVTTEQSILALIRRLRADRSLALLLVTHSLPVAAEMADELCVMYAGEVVERGRTEDCLAQPGHPYTEALARSARSLETSRDGYLVGIDGIVPSHIATADRCLFAPRCSYATEECVAGHPPMVATAAGQAACVHVDRVRPEVTS